MTWQPNIPVALAAADFEQKHADMLASARGEARPVPATGGDWVFESVSESFNRLREEWEQSTVTFPVYYPLRDL